MSEENENNDANMFNQNDEAGSREVFMSGMMIALMCFVVICLVGLIGSHVLSGWFKSVGQVVLSSTAGAASAAGVEITPPPLPKAFEILKKDPTKYCSFNGRPFAVAADKYFAREFVDLFCIEHERLVKHYYQMDANQTFRRLGRLELSSFTTLTESLPKGVHCENNTEVFGVDRSNDYQISLWCATTDRLYSSHFYKTLGEAEHQKRQPTYWTSSHQTFELL